VVALVHRLAAGRGQLLVACRVDIAGLDVEQVARPAGDQDVLGRHAALAGQRVLQLPPQFQDVGM
jgi:hypothetical protein